MDWLAEARELSEAGDLFALATVVRRVAPASAQPGAKAIILHDGTMHGWVGGSCAQPVVTGEAKRAIADGKPRIVRLGHMPGSDGGDQDDVVEYPMTCHSGGALEILIEPVLPSPRIAIVGATPVAETLVRLAGVMGYRVSRHEDGAALADALAAPGAATFVVVASMGDDEEALLAALRAGFPYVALVASPKRALAIRETLIASGIPPEALARLKSPAGLDIGAQSQEEIALSIMAEIVHERAELAKARRSEAEYDARALLEAEALDPVCGMTVAVAGGRHVSEFGGRTWYFCCGGCKARFEADPEQYATA